jgi:hypothetical protein
MRSSARPRCHAPLRALCSGFFAWAVAAGTALAAPARVALVHVAEPSPLEQRTLTRLRAELIAAGFEISEVERRGADLRDADEADPGVAGVFATIAIVPRTADAADVWVTDRSTGQTVVRRLQVPAGTGRDVAAVLAVRAVELLQASLLEAPEPPPHDEPAEPSAAPSTPAPTVPSEVSAAIRRRPSSIARPSDARFALQAGAGVLHSFSGVGPALLPVLGFAYRFSSDVAVGLRVGGPAFAADLQTAAGTIAVRQEIVSLEITYELLSPDAKLRPVAIGGFGAYHIDVVGRAAPPFTGESNDRFAALFTLGPGAKLRLGERVSLLADLRLLLLAPQPVVRSLGAEAGSMSRPSLFGEVAAEVSF